MSGEGWAIFALPAGRRDLGSPELWERSLDRSRRRREMAAARCAEAGITLRIPPIRYCTDNGAMIAALGSAVLRSGAPASDLRFGVDSSMPLTLVHL